MCHRGPLSKRIRGDIFGLYYPPLSSSFSLSLCLSVSGSGVRKYPVETHKKETAETFPFKCLAVRVTKAYEHVYTFH
jgi:hypothetical protein